VGTVKPTDIASLISVGAPTVSPDGRTAVVATSRPDLEQDEYRGQLWAVALDGSAPPRQLTRGTRDAAPQFSPDGQWIAFLRTEPKGRPQLHVLPTDGGEARALTDLPGGAGAPRWSPDSARIAFSARVPEEGRYGQDEKITPDKEPPRRITGLKYRRDGLGFLVDRREQIFVVDVDSDDAEPQQVTEGDFDSSDVTWSPDGEWLAFVSGRHDSREHDINADVFVMRRDGTQLRQVTDSSLALGGPVFTPSGDTVLFRALDPGADRTHWVARQLGLYAVPAAGGPARRLTDEERYNLVDCDLVVEGDHVLVLAENRGANDLLAVPLSGGEPSVVSAGRRQITGFGVGAGTIAVSYKDETTSGEVAVLDDGEVRRRTDFGARLRDQVAPRPIVELNTVAPDGQQLHGFLVTPEGDGPHPVLLMIHGGPFAQYGWSLFDEAQVYAGAGYAVVYTNPRGSSGYGAAYGDWIRGDVGERSAADLLAMLDDALSRPDLDENRVGVLGGSHGGFMTTWLVGHTDRFLAAVSERAVNAIDSFTGSSDIGWGFADDLYGRDLEQQRLQSPLSYADKITTPLLIVHSEQDWRCPIEQAQRLYVALRSRDADVEMLIFPGEGHELSRSGLPSHRVARFEAILDWFGRYLPVRHKGA
jgi:dipeptidyl aminopeptidase/acylaminoacyl peptidase